MDIIKRNYILEVQSDEGRVFIGSDIGPIKLGKRSTPDDGSGSHEDYAYYMVEQSGRRYIVELTAMYCCSHIVSNSYKVYEL